MRRKDAIRKWLFLRKIMREGGMTVWRIMWTVRRNPIKALQM